MSEAGELVMRKKKARKLGEELEVLAGMSRQLMQQIADAKEPDPAVNYHFSVVLGEWQYTAELHRVVTEKLDNLPRQPTIK